VTAERARPAGGNTPGVTVTGGTPVVAQVPVEHWQVVARFAKDTLGCGFFSFSTVIDWQADGFEVLAWVDNLDANVSVQLRTRLGAGNTVCPSLVPVYLGADWMERESYDMFGVRFAGHPDLRRILLSEDWEGHPLLKSYAVDTPYPPYR
jgi:NADH-quinone oxidoreductase subunit C